MSVLSIVGAIGLMALFIGLLIGVLVEPEHPLFTVLLLILTGIAVVGAWYSWNESRSVSWTTGFGLAAALGLLIVIRRMRRPMRPDKE